MSLIESRTSVTTFVLSTSPGTNRVYERLPVSLNNVQGLVINWIERPPLTADPRVLTIVDNRGELNGNGHQHLSGFDFPGNPPNTILSLDVDDHTAKQLYKYGDYHMIRSWSNTFSMSIVDLSVVDADGNAVLPSSGTGQLRMLWSVHSILPR